MVGISLTNGDKCILDVKVSPKAAHHSRRQSVDRLNFVLRHPSPLSLPPICDTAVWIYISAESLPRSRRTEHLQPRCKLLFSSYYLAWLALWLAHLCRGRKDSSSWPAIIALTMDAVQGGNRAELLLLHTWIKQASQALPQNSHQILSHPYSIESPP